MTPSTSSIDEWFPPPETWPELACRRCTAPMRVLYPPSDGLCSECRRSEAHVAVGKTVEERLAEAGAPPRYAALTRASWERCYGRWEDHPQLGRLVGWPHERRRGSWLVFITSPRYGDRKTGLATSVLGEALVHGWSGRWVSQAGWLRELKASWRGGRDVVPEHRVWNRAAEARVLCFDDLGGLEGWTKDWWRTQVTELLHHREAHQLPTIVTANLPDWREVRRIHESLLSRMDVPLKIVLPSTRDHRSSRYRGEKPLPAAKVPETK